MRRANYSLLAFLLLLPSSLAFSALAHESQALRQVGEGVVHKFLINPTGEIEGLLLDGGQLVHVSLALSPQLGESLKVGDRVQLEGEKLPDGEIRASAIVDVKDRVRLVERISSPHSGGRHEALKPMKVQGRIARVFLGPSRDLNQVLLSDGSQIRVPREAAVALRGEFKAGSEFAAEGMGTQNQYGRSMEATAIGTSLAALRPIFGRATPAAE